MNNKARCESLRLWEKTFYMAKNFFFFLKVWPHYEPFFDISAAPEVTAEDAEKDIEVAFSPGEWHWRGLLRGALFFMAVGLWVLEVVTVENVNKSSSMQYLGAVLYDDFICSFEYLTHTFLTYMHTHMLRYPCGATEHNRVYPLWPSQFESEVGLGCLSWSHCHEVQPKP